MRIESAWRYEKETTDADNVLSERGASALSVGLCGSCSECQSDYGMTPREFFSAVENGTVCDEGGFSSYDCEHCGQSLGGDRYAAHCMEKDGSLSHLSVCCDCLQSIANGESPQPTDIDAELDKVDELISNPFAWPGGYARFAVCTDGGVLCATCVSEECDNIKDSIDSKCNDGWRIDGYDHTGNCDDVPVCDHCGHHVDITDDERAAS